MKKATLVRLEPPTLAYLQRLSDTYSKSQANLIRACIEAGLPIVEQALIRQNRQFIKQQTKITQKQLLGNDPERLISSSMHVVSDPVVGESEHRLMTSQVSAPRAGRPRKKAEPPRRKSTRPIDLDNIDEKSK